MPKVSERESLLKEIDASLKLMAMLDDDETEDFEELMEVRACLEDVRYVDLRKYETKKRSMNDLLWSYTDASFRQTVRMDKASFLGLLQLISPHEVFHRITRNRHRVYCAKQTPIWIQLMVVLIRLGCNGNGVSLGAVGRNCGYSSGSIVLFTQRVFTAICALEKRFLSWPDATERVKISKRFAENYGLPGAVTIVDGTHVVFNQREYKVHT